MSTATKAARKTTIETLADYTIWYSIEDDDYELTDSTGYLVDSFETLALAREGVTSEMAALAMALLDAGRHDVETLAKLLALLGG